MYVKVHINIPGHGWAIYFDQAKERSSDRTKFVENIVNLSYEIAECYIIINLKEQTGSSKEVSYQDYWCFRIGSPGRFQ